MRAAQPFAMRYPLVEVEGSYGNLMESGNWSAPRYTSSRLSEITDNLFLDINKDTIKEWRDNYDDTEKYPTVLPTKGFYNIVNGTSGIGVGAASSSPQYNIKDVNSALIKLLWDKDIDFEEIFCVPDFATGAILLNENEVKESIKNGKGASCRLRSVIEYDSKDRVFVVTEIPYGVYTNTICGQLENILNSEDNPGIDSFNDLTGKNPLIKIYLTKKANPDKVLKALYKNTSLESYYGINMTMLEDGRFPRVFTWKEALQAHIDHEIEVYTRGFQYDLNKIENRLHIIEALLKAIANIDKVVELIKTSTSSADASKKLQLFLKIDEAQAKAILDIKLSRLAHLEVEKLEKEKAELIKEKERISAILNDEILLKKEIEKGLRDVAEKFGDERRTKIMNISENEDEPTEVKSIIINLTNKNNIYTSEASSLYTQKRGTVGTKIKMEKNEYIISTTTAETNNTVLLFTKDGYFYSLNAADLPIDDKYCLAFDDVCAIATYNRNNAQKNIMFLTKFGYLKKSLLQEYNIKKSSKSKAINLEEGDEIVSVIFNNNDRVGILTAEGNYMMCETASINSIGRATKGVMGIKLNSGDYVVDAKVIPQETKEIISVTKNGHTQRTSIDEFSTTGRATKGKKLQKLKEDSDILVGFMPISNDSEIIFVSNKAQLKTKVKDITLSYRNNYGVKSIKLKDKEYIVNLIKI